MIILISRVQVRIGACVVTTTHVCEPRRRRRYWAGNLFVQQSSDPNRRPRERRPSIGFPCVTQKNCTPSCTRPVRRKRRPFVFFSPLPRNRVRLRSLFAATPFAPPNSSEIEIGRRRWSEVRNVPEDSEGGRGVCFSFGRVVAQSSHKDLSKTNFSSVRQREPEKKIEIYGREPGVRFHFGDFTKVIFYMQF